MRAWFITGASKGLGAAIARVALEHGEHVALAARGIAADHPLVRRFPDRAVPLKLDLTDNSSIEQAIRRAQEKLGPIDVLLNNAGQGILGAIEETSDSEMRALFDVNFFGVATTIRTVLPSMRKRGRGLIINVGSVAGFVANPGTGAYCATKFALEALTEALRKEVAGLGIKVSMAAPGGMRTGFNGASVWRTAATLEEYRSSAGARTTDLQTHAGRRGSDVDAAAMAIWHLSISSEPPSHLVLGADAIERIDQKLSLIREHLALADPLA